MNGLLQQLRSGRLMARVFRSTSWILLGYGGSQGLRLASNLILTRILFPEAFGLMALISLVTVGLMLFSDVGIAPSIAQSKRGDDPDFLNTAWSIQVIRGICLWVIATALAVPLSVFYAAPELATYLPIAALALLVTGFNPTRIETAHRHLLMGRLTVLDLTSQAVGIAVMIVLAWWLQSVVALVVGGVVGPLVKLALTWAFLPGAANRFRWEPAAVRELVTFGKWIFLSTAFWFFASQGDRAVLGKFLSLESLGIYNIAFFLASFAMQLGTAVTGRVMIPVYRDAKHEVAKIAKLRFAISGVVLMLLLTMALAGPWLVGVLYDARYAMAGAIVTLLAVAQTPAVIGMSYDQAALAAGDSRRFFVVSATRAVLQITLLIAGVSMFGIVGAIVGMGLAHLFTHPVIIWLARQHDAWDARHDLVCAIGAGSVGAAALWLHWDAISALSALN
ncbi:oligosaccharide flippase family protein [Sulfitobacter sp. F26169L]|uniref:oligosaccharide flippase family protein n=1 Tax=Sulfitobacter sp. F26169L TaxID=2996015 RepID=UPI00226102B2|nr:oligosaccharide flippase family protein [Sulfitobacter sp. F26169L]MCX7566448.1 oligosaccharide flippase family protein [Sulfitobacter sp. F26169L]